MPTTMVPAAHLKPLTDGASPDATREHVTLDQVNVERLTNVEGKIWEINVTIAAELGFGALVQYKSDADVRVFVFDIMTSVTTLKVEPELLDATATYSVLGLGVRACFTVEKIEGEASVNVDEFAARVTADGLTSNMRIESIGLLDKSTEEIAALFAGVTFDTQFMERIAKACVVVSNDLAARYGDIDVYKIQEVKVRAITDYTFENGISSSYAVQSICMSRSRNAALTRLQKKLLEKPKNGVYPYAYDRVADLIVTGVYGKLMPKSEPDQKPTSAQKAAAEKILRSRPKEKK